LDRAGAPRSDWHTSDGDIARRSKYEQSLMPNGLDPALAIAAYRSFIAKRADRVAS
jgi:hypothetical protein